MLRPHLPTTGRRYLDVGCGFGGFLVAFAELGYTVKGIEIDADRIVLSRANCADHALQDCVHAGSVLDATFTKTLGHFDVITCIDVIEHVLDVPLALTHMASLLNPGGVLLLEIPNLDSLNFVASDGHFGLCGITQLDRQMAIEYHRTFFGFEYDVGEYHELAFYRARLETLGCETVLMTPGSHPARRVRQTPLLLANLCLRYTRFLARQAPHVPPQVFTRLHTALAVFFGRLAVRGLAAVTGSRAAIGFRDRYLVDFWTLLARKAK